MLEPHSGAACNRHLYAMLGIMGNHRKVLHNINNVDFSVTHGQWLKPTNYCLNSKGIVKFGKHANEESGGIDWDQHKELPISDLVGHFFQIYCGLTWQYGFYFEHDRFK